MGYGPATGPALKTALSIHSSDGGTDNKYRSVLSLGDARQETSLDVGLLKKIVAGKKEFIGRS